MLTTGYKEMLWKQCKHTAENNILLFQEALLYLLHYMLLMHAICKYCIYITLGFYKVDSIFKYEGYVSCKWRGEIIDVVIHVKEIWLRTFKLLTLFLGIIF